LIAEIVNEVRYIFVIIPLVCIATRAYCQKLTEIVNSPKAFHLEAEMKDLRQGYDSLSQVYFRWRDEFNRLLKEGKEKDDLSLYNEFSKERRAEYDALWQKRDSISKILTKKRIARSKEIIKTEEMKAVLKKMLKAEEAGDKKATLIIKKDYIDSLENATMKKLRLKQIDIEAMQAEIEAINEINNALEVLAFPPVKVVDQIIDRWE